VKGKPCRRHCANRNGNSHGNLRRLITLHPPVAVSVASHIDHLRWSRYIHYHDFNSELRSLGRIAWCVAAVQMEGHVERLALDLEGFGLAGIFHLAVFLEIVGAFGVQVPA
jgi:hypothetical protein